LTIELDFPSCWEI